MQNMLSTIILLFVFVFVVEGINNSMTWEEYKETFDKSYNTTDLDKQHKAAFLKTQQNVLQHNAKYAAGEKKYTVGLNQLSDLLQHEKDRMRGHKSRHQHTRRQRQVSCNFYVPDPAAVVPASVDWRTQGYVTPVKSQGFCGSCYTFSATGALEGQMMRKTGILPSLSEQNIVDCDKIDGGCNGGNAANVFSYVQTNGGIDTEASYPYSTTTYTTGVGGTTCAYNPANSAGDSTGCVAILPLNETAMQIAVATVGPISIALYANFSEFENFAGPGMY
jgi:cathepsin L